MMVLAVLLAGSTLPAHAQKSAYSTPKEAYEIGLTFLDNKNLAKAQEALEEALKLAPDDVLKKKIYRALVRPYQMQADVDKLVDALEFVIRHPSSPAEKSLARGSLLSGVQAKGKSKEVTARFEDALKKTPDDETVLYILGGIYANLQQDPKRSAIMLEQYLAAFKKTNKDNVDVDVDTSAQLAEQYVKAMKFKEGAELFEQIAPADATRKAWHLKEAAVAWLKAKEKEKAIAAATASAMVKEERSKQLTHYWHRALGELFLDTGEFKRAVEQLEKAVQSTDIDGYKKDCQKKLEEARSKQ